MPTATTNDLTEADWGRLATELAHLGADECTRFLAAVHEAGHAVAAVALGGHIHKAVLGDCPRTEYEALPEHIIAPTTYAGPWCEARAAARLAGRRGNPGPRAMSRAMAANCADRKALTAAGGPASGLDVVPLLEHCWPAVLTVAGRLFTTGRACHTDVCSALNLSDEGGPGSFELACLRSVLRAV